MIYDHEQSNPGLAFTLLAGAFGMLVLVLATGEPGPIFGSAFLGMIAFVGFAFSGLRTSVGPHTIEVAFRFGRPQRTIALGQVVRAEVVRNKWWYGWGVRWIPGGTMWNVWGLDAVQLDLAGQRSFRIGTDDPDGLVAAISVLRGAPGPDGRWDGS